MDNIINQINAFIDDHLKQEFTLTEVADALRYSPYHLAREFKKLTGHSIMEQARNRKIFAAAQALAENRNVLETALAYGFDTHSGFTRAFVEIIGCTPQEYHQHSVTLKQKGEWHMNNDTSKLVIRLVDEDDVNDLWENAYSAMTPRQITEDKILPCKNNYNNQTGFMAVAELDGTVVMTMWVEKLYSSPGFIFDSHYVWQNNDNDKVFIELVEGVKRFAKQVHMTTLCLYEDVGSPYIEGFVKVGFTKVFQAAELEYYMMAI